MIELRDGFKDAIYVHTDIRFDWKDRLKILLGRTVHVSTVTQTGMPVGRTGTFDVTVSVGRLINGKPKVWFVGLNPDDRTFVD